MSHRRIKDLVAFGAMIGLCCPSLAHTSNYKRTIPAKEIRHVIVGLTSGDVTVKGWDKKEIKVEADEKPTIQVKAHEVVIGSSNGGSAKDAALGKSIKKTSDKSHDHDGSDIGETTKGAVLERIAVEISGQNWVSGDSDLEIWMSKDTRLSIQTISGKVEVTAINGRMRLVTVSGDVKVTSCGGSVDAETVSGDVKVMGLNADLALKTVSGALSAQRVDALLVEAKTVSGDLTLDPTKARTVRISSQSGDVLYSGEIAEDGGLEVNAFSGKTEIRMVSSVAFGLEARSQSGTIQVDRNMDFAERSEHRIRAQTGKGGAQLRLRSFSGDIRIK